MMRCLLILLLCCVHSSAEVSYMPPLDAANQAARAKSLIHLRQLPATTDHELATFLPATDSPDSLRYFFYRPAPSAHHTDQKLPLVVVLHHAGAQYRLEDIVRSNPESIGRWLEPASQQAHPCYVVAPWSGGQHWENGNWKIMAPMAHEASRNAKLALALIDALVHDLPIDRERIYVVGQSMGGFGVWDLVSRRPDFFAAAIPVCGGGDPAQAERLKDLPIWAFHGDADHVIRVEHSRQMATALAAAGSTRFRYWEFPDAGHDPCSERTYTEPGLSEWLFAQKAHVKSLKNP